jgi:hypothetical protein
MYSVFLVRLAQAELHSLGDGYSTMNLCFREEAVVQQRKFLINRPPYQIQKPRFGLFYIAQPHHGNMT